MLKVTSVALHKTALGDQASITYSEIGDDGTVIAQNKRAESVIVDSEVLKAVNKIYDFAQNKIGG